MDECGITTVQEPDRVVACRGVVAFAVFATGRPPGCVGGANLFRCMQEIHFIDYFKHFIRHTKASVDSLHLVHLFIKFISKGRFMVFIFAFPTGPV